MNAWDVVILKAWLMRDEVGSPRRHPPKADRIYKRFATNIERAERYLTAKRMVERYADTAYRRASEHACSYSSTERDYAWKYKYWTDVCDYIKQIQKEV
jgi:hypothetical protein